MKTLRLLSLPLVATIFSISFSACGDDDSDLPSAPVDPQGKHITRIVVMKDNSKDCECIYSYDSQGRIIKFVRKDYNSYTSPTTHAISYGDNSITVYKTQHNMNDSQHIYSLLNGRITNRMSKSGSSVTSYSYDNQGYLTSKDYFSYTWTGGDLTGVRDITTSSDYDITMKYDYNSHIVPANFFSIAFGFRNIESVFAMQGYFGKMPIHYVSNSTSETNNHGKITTSASTYTYQFEDGRPILIECTTKTPSDNDSYVITESKITIEWG